MSQKNRLRTAHRVTSVEVAHLAGVSQSAVSRVFTPGASASAATARKVREAALRLGYRPNALARSLIKGETRIIGLIVAELDNLLYPAALERLSDRFRREGYHIMIFFATDESATPECVVVDLLDYQVEGLIAASVAMTETLAERCNATGIPILLFNRHQGEEGLPSVTSDNFAGGRMAAQFMTQAGLERIAHISGWQGSSTGCERKEGFLAGLSEAGHIVSACLDGEYSRERASEITRLLFSQPVDLRPDGLFVGSDHMAFAVMDTLRNELALRIPEDVSVVGFDDVPMAAWPAYDLTTIRQPLEDMVDIVVKQLLACIVDPQFKPGQTRLNCEIRIRGSSKLPDNFVRS